MEPIELKTVEELSCCCSAKAAPAAAEPGTGRAYFSAKRIGAGAGAILLWALAYSQLEGAAHFIAFRLLGFPEGSHLGESIAFFLYDTPKVMLLLTLAVFSIGIVRSFFTPERTRHILMGKRESLGNVLAALLGTVTPFCSCSAVPLFVGFVSAGVPLGVTFSFLISAPMVNEIALVLLYGLFGLRVAAIYFTTGLLIAMIAGWVIGRLRMEGHLEDWVRDMRGAEAEYQRQEMDWPGRIQYGLDAVRDIVGKVWKYVILGIAVGSAIHGYAPEGFLASIMGRNAWWAVPASVLVGIPMYSNAAGIIPVVQALLEKGAALGTALAFMMSVIALSLPEAVILRQVLKPRLIAVFFGVVGLGILIVGYLFNLLI